MMDLLPRIIKLLRPARLFGMLVLLAVVLFLTSRHARGATVTLNGYSKAFVLAERPAWVDGLPGQADKWNVFDALRLKLAWKPRESLSLNFAYGVAPMISNPASAGEAGFLADPRRYRIADARPRMYPRRTDASGHFTVRHNLDRAYARLSFDRADLFIGRQAIAWGSARAVNPTDVIAPYPFGELDAEERIGVDAVRAVIPLDEKTEINAGYIAGKNGDISNSAIFLRGRTGLGGTDLTLCAVKYRRNLMAGLDLARSIAGAGTWLEAAYTGYGTDRNVSAGSGSFRLSCGLDYRFSDKLYAFVEYHYNGDGEPQTVSYGRSLQKPGYRDGPVYLLARHYAIPAVSYQITPLISSTTNPLVNLNDGSVFLSQQFEYNATQNTYLSAGAYWGIGRTPAFSTQTMIFSPGSEFGSYPGSVFLSYRVYF